MILVDTSVWLDHLRTGSPLLADHLDGGRVLVHPFIIGEVALGNLRQRDLVLDALANLPMAIVAGDEEVLSFIAANDLPGTGIGYVDAHLLAALRLTPGAQLWTNDRRLDAAAARLGLSIRPLD